jgi:hypothetical protein
MLPFAAAGHGVGLARRRKSQKADVAALSALFSAELLLRAELYTKEPPRQKGERMTNPDQKQAPGIYRRRIGDAMVTVINDGYLDMPFELLRGVSLEDMRALMREVFHEGPPRITVNAYVVQTGGRTFSSMPAAAARRCFQWGSCRRISAWPASPRPISTRSS